MTKHLQHVSPSAVDAQSTFRAELDDVSKRVQGALADLYSPLSNLAANHIRRVQPPVRAAVVLAAGVAENEAPDLREKRVLLASALEMLAVALSIHTQLMSLDGSQDATLDKSLVGSTILAGDYCFSRAAVLAAQTDSPVVVDVFSQALKTVSEGHLRGVFTPGDAAFSETAELMSAGVRAAGHLAGLSPDALATGLALSAAADSPHAAGLVSPALSPVQRLRWQAALAWFGVNLPSV